MLANGGSKWHCFGFQALQLKPLCNALRRDGDIDLHIAEHPRQARQAEAAGNLAGIELRQFAGRQVRDEPANHAHQALAADALATADGDQRQPGCTGRVKDRRARRATDSAAGWLKVHLEVSR